MKDWLNNNLSFATRSSHLWDRMLFQSLADSQESFLFLTSSPTVLALLVNVSYQSI